MANAVDALNCWIKSLRDTGHEEARELELARMTVDSLERARAERDAEIADCENSIRKLGGTVAAYVVGERDDLAD